jgi:lipid A 3-O-deacylase
MRAACQEPTTAQAPGSRRAAARCLATGLCLAALAVAANAAEPPAHPAPNPACGGSSAIEFRGFTTRLENDLIVNTDRDYTNGVSFTAISRDIPGEIDPDCLPLPVRLHARLIRAVDPGFWHDAGQTPRAQNVVFKFGQSMYTPGDPTRTDLISDDRPYAGLLYVGLSWNRRNLDEKAKVETLDTREVTLGVIGPLSLAQYAQDLVHDLRGFDRFLGWRHQLGNEPALQVARERKYRDYRGPGAQIAGFSVDSIRSFGLQLGNIETSASYSVETRIGWNLPNDFGTYPIRPGAENRPPAPTVKMDREPARARAGAHLFAMLEGKVVAHDFSLDGNLFRNSHKVSRRPLVGQAALGFSVHGPVLGHDLKLAVMRVWRSREFDEQRARHAFGSISLTIDF